MSSVFVGELATVTSAPAAEMSITLPPGTNTWCQPSQQSSLCQSTNPSPNGSKKNTVRSVVWPTTRVVKMWLLPGESLIDMISPHNLKGHVLY